MASERVGADNHDVDIATNGRLQQPPGDNMEAPFVNGCNSQCLLEGAHTQRSTSSTAVKVMTDSRFLARIFAFVGVEGWRGGMHGVVGRVNRAWQHAAYHPQQQQRQKHDTSQQLEQQPSVQSQHSHGATDTPEVRALGYSEKKGAPSVDPREKPDLCVGVEDRYDYVRALPTVDIAAADSLTVLFEVWDEMDGTTLLSADGTMEFEDACVVGDDDDSDTICTFVSVVSDRAARTGADTRTHMYTAGTPLSAASRDPVNRRFSSMEDYLCRCHVIGCASRVGMRVSMCSAHTGKVAVLWESSSDVVLAVEEPVIGMSKLLKLPPGTRQVYTTQLVTLCGGGSGDNAGGNGAGDVAVAGGGGGHDRDRACGGTGVGVCAETKHKPMEADIQFYICPLPGQEGVNAQEKLWRFWAADACAEEGMSFLNLAVNAELQDAVRHVRSLFV